GCGRTGQTSASGPTPDPGPAPGSASPPPSQCLLRGPRPGVEGMPPHCATTPAWRACHGMLSCRSRPAPALAYPSPYHTRTETQKSPPHPAAMAEWGGFCVSGRFLLLHVQLVAPRGSESAVLLYVVKVLLPLLTLSDSGVQEKLE